MAHLNPKAQRQRWLYDVRQYAILTDDAANFLILQLPKEYDESAANTWTLPGGKLEPTDNPAEGVKREIMEETGLEATIHGPCGIARWSTRNSKKLGIFYKASVAGIKPKLNISNEHQRAFWITLDELKDYPFHRKDMVAIIRETMENK
ncbi:MAG: NUDIX hydrolase [Alphaproteobacteria bacterium]